MKHSNKKLVIAISFVLFVASLLRLWGIGYDLPYIYHPDEPHYIVISQNIFKTGDLNPHFFNYPSLFFYINSLAYIPYYFYGKVLGVFNSPQDIIAPISLVMGVTKSPMPTTVLLGRIVTTFFSILSVLLTYFIGTKLMDSAIIGLLSALMVAISPTNVLHSHFVTPDTFVTFFILGAFMMSVLIFRHGATWHYIIAGIGVGLAASSKYNGALILVSLLVAHFLRCGKNGFRDYRLYLALFISGLAFLATTPFALLDYSKFITDLRFETIHYSTGHAGMEGNTLQWYLNFLWSTIGIISLLAVLGILCGFYLRSRRLFLLSVFPIVYFVFISRYVVRNDRTIMLLTPFLFLLAASCLVYLFREINKVGVVGIVHRLSFIGISCILVISLVQPLTKTIENVAKLTTINSRETARIWMTDNLPPGTRLAIEPYTPFVEPNNFIVQGFGRIIDKPPDWYIDNNFEYLVFGEGMFGRFYREPDRYHNEVEMYNMFFDRFDPVKIFTDGGYEVRIYSINR